MESSDRPPPRLLVGIAASAGAVLLLEIGLTRIFSYTIWYHFAYLTISVALLGFGAAGSALAAWPGLARRRGFLAWAAVAAQLGVLLCLLVIDRVSLDPLEITSDPGQAARMLLYYVAVTLPFLAGGFLVAVPLQMYARHVSRLYFWDLLGAGLACGSIVPLIWWLGTPLATGMASVLLLLAVAAYAEPALRARQLLAAVTAAAATLAVAGGSSFAPAPSKFASRFLQNPSARIAFHRWTPINRMDLIEEDPPLAVGAYHVWGMSPHYQGDAPPFYMIGNDGDSCAVMYLWDGQLGSLEFLRHHVLRAPYLLLDSPSVVAIGLGGGADVLNGLVNGARHVTGVEINPATVHAVRDLYADRNGGILRRPDVSAVVGEGRSFLRSSDARYDLVEINSVDTLAALSTGAYVLSESYLYTAEAVGDYLDHLEPGGIFAMAVGDRQSYGDAPVHTLRLASVVRRALEQRGVTAPQRHVMVVGTEGELPLSHTLVKNEPFDAEEVATMQRFLEQEGLVFWHRPDRPVDTLTSRILFWPRGKLEWFYANHPLNLRPTSDDSPFFFNFYKWRTLFREDLSFLRVGYDRSFATGQVMLLVMLAQAALFSGLLVLLPLRRVPLETGGGFAERVAFLGYFGALGTGFILLEISLIQRFVLFLGYPTYSLTVVMLALLVSTGVGSLATGRIESGFARALPGRLALLVGLVAALLLGAPRVFDALLGAPLALRIAASVALLAPLGLVLGGFFPLGIRLAERANPRLVPWAWAVNGCATVVGTLLAVIAGMTWSFSVVALAALGIYGVGVLGVVAVEARRP